MSLRSDLGTMSEGLEDMSVDLARVADALEELVTCLKALQEAVRATLRPFQVVAGLIPPSVLVRGSDDR